MSCVLGVWPRACVWNLNSDWSLLSSVFVIIWALMILFKASGLLLFLVCLWASFLFLHFCILGCSDCLSWFPEFQFPVSPVKSLCLCLFTFLCLSGLCVLSLWKTLQSNMVTLFQQENHAAKHTLLFASVGWLESTDWDHNLRDLYLGQWAVK